MSHAVAGSKDMAVQFFDEVIPMRLADEAGAGLRALTRDAGFIGDPKTRELHALADAPRTTYPTSWLPTKALAVAWRKLVGRDN